MRKQFIQGLNADDDFSSMSPGEWVNAMNIRVFSTDKGAVDRVESIGGTKLLYKLTEPGQNICIGAAVDEGRDRILSLVWNSDGQHAIYSYDLKLKTGYKVLGQADVEGGLNFSKSIIHACFYINGCLYWVEGDVNHPRRIDIDAATKANNPAFITDKEPYVLPVSQNVIRWIRKAGNLCLDVTKFTSADVLGNYISERAFQFCYRYSYRNYEESVLSGLSDLINYNSDKQTFNSVRIDFPLGEKIDQDVISVEMVLRKVPSGVCLIIHSFKDFSDHNSGVKALTYNYTGDTSGQILDEAYVAKSFEFVPDYAETIEVAKNRAFVANYTEGEDTPGRTSLNMQFVMKQIQSGGIPTSITGDWLIMEFQGTQFYLLRTYFPLQYITAPAAVYYYEYLLGAPPLPDTVLLSDLKFISSTPWGVGIHYGFPISRQIQYKEINQNKTSTIITGASQVDDLSTNVFKSRSSYRGGIVFYNQFRQRCGVRTLTRKRYSYAVIVPQQNYSWATGGLNSISIENIDTTNILVGDHLQIENSPIQGEYIITAIATLGTNATFTTTEDFGRLLTGSSGISVTRPTDIFDSLNVPAVVNGRYAVSLAWTLENTDPTEIPLFATHYSIVLTDCLTTRFFINGIGLVSYATRAIDQTLTLINSFSGSTYIVIDTSGIEAFGMGYIFNEKHIVEIEGKSTSVIGAEGRFILLKPIDIGTLSNQFKTFELRSPHESTESEPFYDASPVYPISDPGLPTRKYSALAGDIQGDTYILRRRYSGTDFISESMSPNDKLWKEWNLNRGWANAIDTIGRVRKFMGRRFSNVFIQGAKVNGLSSFEALNEDILDEEVGPIRKLQVTSKVQADGSVLLNLCENHPVSTYLGETEIFDTRGTSTLAKSNAVLGTSTALRGGNGTSNPESVIEHKGQVFWWDIKNGEIAQYSVNGVFTISNYKFTRAASLISKAYRSLDTAVIEAYGSRPFIVAGINSKHGELLFTIPTTGLPPKGYLEDYPELAYPYDIHDGKGKTLMFKKDAWIGSMGFQAEKFINIGDRLFSFEGGSLYEQNQESDTLHGKQFTSKLMFPLNPGGIHTFLGIGIEGNKKPKFVHYRTEDPNIQSSDNILKDFSEKEGVISAPLYRDRLSPNIVGDFDRKQFVGRRLYGKALLVMLEYEVDNGDLQLRAVNFNTVLRTGTLINKP